MSNEIAIILSLCVPAVFIIIRRIGLTSIHFIDHAGRRLISWLCHSGRRPGIWNQQISHEISMTRITGIKEVLASTGDEDNPFKAIHGVYSGLRNLRKTEDKISDELKLIWQRDFPSVLGRLWRNSTFAVSVVLVSALVLGLACAILYAGIASAQIVSGSSGPCNACNAGIWELSDYDHHHAVRGDTHIAFKKEEIATRYAEKCYGKGDNDVDRGKFYAKEMLMKTDYNSPCPFDNDMCVGGPHSALKMSSGLVDSKILGINTRVASRFTFERAITCAPIFNDDRYQSYDESENAWLFKYMTDGARYYKAERVPGPSDMDLINKYNGFREEKPQSTYRAW